MTVDVSARPKFRERRFSVFIATFLTMLLAISGLAAPAHAQQNTLVVNMPSASETQNGLPVYKSGETLAVQIGYGVMDDGFTGSIKVPSQVDPASIEEDLRGNTAIDTIDIADDGTITFTFVDPFPADVQQGFFTLNVTLKESESSSKETLEWELPNGTKQSIDVIIKGDDDEFNGVENYQEKRISSNPNFKATVDDGKVVVDSEALLNTAVHYRIFINTVEGGTFNLADTLDEGLVYVDGSFSGERETWDANGMNKQVASVDVSQHGAESSFTESVTLPPNSEFILEYRVKIKDQAALDALVAKLQADYDAKKAAAGDNEFATINFSTTLGNSVTFDGGNKKTATFGIKGTEAGRVGPKLGGVFAKSSDFTTANIKDPESNDFDEVDLTYTLKADLTPFEGFGGTSEGINDNVVIVDTLPVNIEWRSGEANFLTAEGMVLTPASATGTLTKSEFAADEYVGQYYVEGKTLLINIGKDTTTEVSIDVLATITDLDGISRDGGNSAYEEARYWGPNNTATLNYGDRKITRKAEHSFTVLKDGSSGINDPQKFNKTTVSDQPIAITQGEPALIDFQFQIGANIGDARGSTVVDKIDHNVFDVTEETLEAIKASITGQYDGNYPIDGDTMDVSIDADGNLVFAPNDQFPKTPNLGSEAEEPLTKSYTFTVTIPTHPLYGKQTLEIENSATYRGKDSDTLYDSTASAAATSYGNEMELRKRVLNEESGTLVSQLRVELDDDGSLVNDEFVYAVELIPHGEFTNMVLDVSDVLPAEVEFLGFIGANDFEAGNLDNISDGPAKLTNTAAEASYADGTVVISKGTLTKGQISTLYFKVKLTDFKQDQPIVNVIGNAEATIVPSNDYPLNIIKVDTSNEENKITDTSAIFQIKQGDNVVVDNVYVVDGVLVVAGEGGTHKPVAVKEAGEYTIVEIKAPAGFLRTDQELTVSISEQGVQTPDQVRINNEPGEELEPAIGTSVAVDGSDVKVLPVSGGTVIDTVTYEGLTVGQKYVLEGELFTKDGVATGIKASQEFTAETVDGSVDVEFTISADQIVEYAGQELVAFESLFELNDDVKSDDPVAEHRDVEDEAQTFTVDELPVADPAIGTTAKVTGATDKVLPLTGGQVIDTVAYKDLQPNTKYVLQGVIQHVATGGTVTSTDVVASTVFTTGDAPAGEFFVSGNAEVKFNIDQATAAEYAGERLVVFEQLWLADDNGNKAGDEPVAVHEDPTDEAQTFYAGEKPDAIPGIGTTAKVTGSADKVLPLTGGEIVDTVAYKDLQPNTEYVLNGEIQHVAEDGTVTSTGVIATATFTTGAAKSGEFYVSGTTTVTFDIDEQTAIKYAGEKLVVFETLYTAGNPETPVASHVDPEDEAQSFTVAPQPEADVVVEKTVTGPKGAQVEADENALFQITATWTDKLGRNFSKTFNVVPGKPVSLEGLPTNTEIYLSETGATTDVKNVKWGDVIWTGEGVADETGTSKGATVTFTGEAPFEIGLENKTSSNGMLIIPIPIPLFPIDGGSSTSPIQPDPTQPDPKESVDPSNPTPSEGTEAGTSPSKDKGTEQPETVKPRTPSEKGGLAQTGANVAWVAGIAILLLLAGAAFIVRGRRKDV